MTRLSHSSHGKVGRRRSQLAMKKRNIMVCPSCKGPTFGHRMCPQCGAYVKAAKPAKK